MRTLTTTLLDTVMKIVRVQFELFYVKICQSYKKLPINYQP